MAEHKQAVNPASTILATVYHCADINHERRK